MSEQKLLKRVSYFYFTFLFFIPKAFAMGTLIFNQNTALLTLPSIPSQFIISKTDITRIKSNKNLIYFKNKPARKVYIELLKKFHVSKPNSYILMVDDFSLNYNPNDFQVSIIKSDEIICYLNKDKIKNNYHCSLQIVRNNTKPEKVNFPRPRMGVSNNSLPIIDHLCATEDTLCHF